MQRPLHHPAIEDVTLEGVLHALADPTRLEIVRRLAGAEGALNCSAAAPAGLPKSTLSHHFQVLREAGLIRSERRGTEVANTLRKHEIDAKLGGLLDAIIKVAAAQGRVGEAEIGT